MKIAFFIPDFSGGGAQHMVVNMANEFARRGDEVSLIVLHEKGPHKAKVSGDVQIVNLNVSRALFGWWELVRYLRRAQPDILLSAMTYINLLAVLARFAAPRMKVVVTERTIFSLDTKHNGRVIDKMLPMVMRLVYPFADKVVGISKGGAEDIQKVAGLSADKVTWIHNPVITPDMEARMNEPVDDAWLTRDDTPLIVTSGRLAPGKGHDAIFEAFAILRKDKPARLVLLGDGPLRGALEQKAKDLSIAGDVHFAGFVANPLPTMKAAQLFVMASHWEGFCNVIVEALFCGLPVVSTDCPSGPAEILDKGRFGTLVSVGNVPGLASAMIVALDNSADPEVQKNRALDFTAEKICNQYEQLFRGLS